MKHIRIILLVVFAMLLSGCSLFGGDDGGVDLSTDETITPEPTANVVQPVPGDDTETATADSTDEVDEAGAPLPTAVTIPATPVPAEPTPDRSQPTTYVVQAGDVLGLIAERFDVDIAELRRINDLSGNLIRVGQELTIPALDGSDAVLADETDGGDETASGPVGSTTPSTPSPSPTPVSCGANAVGHCVQSGDSLLGIASQYGVTVDALRAANPSITGDQILIGDLLTIPGQTTGGTTGGDTSGGTTGGDTSGGDTSQTPVATAAPLNDADCAARNPDFPFFHAADGLCYANPIGPTAVPTAQGSDPDTECPEGTFLWEDGLCYPIPGVTPTPAPTPTASTVTVDYGDGPDCPESFVLLESTNKCWPGETTTQAQKEAACKSNCDFIA